MATQSRQQVAAQLNKLQTSGASEQQIEAYIAQSGYTNTDFNVSLTGSFEPMQETRGKVAGVDYDVPTKAEQAEGDAYYNSLASSSSVQAQPPNTRTVTTTITRTDTLQQSTGGGTTTVRTSQPTATPESTALEDQAKLQSKKAAAYAANPESKLGQKTLDRSLAEGTISQEEYDKIKNATPAEREANFEKSKEFRKEATSLNDQAAAAKTGGDPTTEVTPAYNTSEVSTKYEKTTTETSTVVDGAVPENGVVVSEIDNQTYQVVNNNDGTRSYTPVGQPAGVGQDLSVTVDDDSNAPLQEPPGTQDEFSGVDTQVEANENLLAEPPELTNEEVDEYLGNTGAPEDNVPIDEEDVISNSGAQGLTEGKTNAQGQATAQDQAQFTKQEDWRVRLSLSPSATYLYKGNNPGILKPLADTGGVIFPYTPSIQISYAANYDATDLIHTNYKVYQYKNSAVDNISISCDFTAQDTYEANYLLAVIHFFRSVTKMFYGQDNGPKPGTPPPLCFLTGLGTFQFNEHPLAITSFTYNLPTDVDYIRAGQATSLAGVNTQSNNTPTNTYNPSNARLNNIKPGGNPSDTVWQSSSPQDSTVTYVPTKMTLQIGAIPMISRNDVSNNFSLADYASGKLLRGLQNVRGGFW